MVDVNFDPEQKIFIFMNDLFWVDLIELDENFNAIEKIIQKEVFRVSHTDLTYRQINYFDEAGLIGSGRNKSVNGSSWRLFKFRDIVYLNVIAELKKFGIRNDKLKLVHELFYSFPRNMDEVILACLGGAEMTLILDSKCTGFVLNPNYLGMYDDSGYFKKGRDNAEIRMTINSAVNKTLKSLGKEEVKITNSVSKMAYKYILEKPSDTELKILKVIRDNDYEKILLKKKNGQPCVLYAETKSKSNISEKELMQEIIKQNYSDVEIKKRDGKVVNYRHKTTIKL